MDEKLKDAFHKAYEGEAKAALRLKIFAKKADEEALPQGMHREREILKHQLYILFVFFQQLLEGRLDPRTIWSLVIAEYHERDRCVLRTLERQPFQRKMLNNRQLNDLQGLFSAA